MVGMTVRIGAAVVGWSLLFVAGSCVHDKAQVGGPCEADQTECAGDCVDTLHDRSHCGSCGNACGPIELCNQGSCAAECLGGTLACGDDCVDTNVDPANCGDCGNVCAAGELCSVGTCAVSCGGGTTQCGNLCVDTDIDTNHCGTCDHACPGSACVAGTCAPAPSCRALLESDPTHASGTYSIDPDGPGSVAPFDVYCDMDNEGGGWTRIAEIGETNLVLGAADYADGLNAYGAVSYIHPCTAFISMGDETIARVTMGAVVDYFKPTVGTSLCEMLQASTKHRWSAALTGVFVEPGYNGGSLGGSAMGWPTDGRSYLSFWGGSSSGSGCCHASYSDVAAWGRTFTLDVREP